MMASGEREFDVVVVGGGHAGCEAALAAARMGRSVALVTLHVDKIALMPCNPAVGGVGKGQLTREIDALGGEQGANADRTFVQIKMLNTSKGPAVQALRVQADKKLYEDWMKRVLVGAPGLSIVQGEVAGVSVSRETVEGLTLADGRRLKAGAVVVATGTFMRGRLVVGDTSYPGGRVGELPARSLSKSLEEAGLELGRFQSATPPRVDGRTLNREAMIEQPGDEGPLGFSNWRLPDPRPQTSCYLTYTTSATHQTVSDYLHMSPIKSGAVTSKGPRYCPSIDRKIISFPDRDRHPVFAEPEGLRTHEVYLQGLTTSLPVDVQEKIIRATPGLENARLMRPGYAVEYDYVLPHQLRLSLESKTVAGLFCAGQINGTSGYEEAAAQGLMAGINASRLVTEEEPVILGREEAYIGVLLDDLVTKQVDEPYRMFTSRAEYRLLLRHDNAAERLSPLGADLGLISEEKLDRVLEKQKKVDRYAQMLEGIRVQPGAETAEALETLGTTPLSEPQSAAQVFRRPQVDFSGLLTLLGPADREALGAVEPEVAERLSINAQYAGYIERQQEAIERTRATEHKRIPEEIDYTLLEGITVEARDKLERFRPETLGQASRIAGVSPADVSLLALYVHRLEPGRESVSSPR